MSHHKDFGVRNTGLIVSLNNPFVAASPDGLVSGSCHPDRLVQIKCPYKYKETTPTDSMALNDPNYCLTKEGQLKKSHRYYCQVPTQLFVTQAPLCDFVVWTAHDMVILSIERDEEYVTNLKAKMQDFTINYLIPALISHKLENLNVLSAVDGNSLFCVCQKPAFGKMIQCANDNCDIVKFHYACVNITRKPRSKWFYESCVLNV